MYTRKIKNRIKETLKRGKSILLLGARQTGKTTLIKSIPHQNYITLMNTKTRNEYEKTPGKLIEEIKALSENSPKKPLILVDEVQKFPDLMDDIQVLIDENIAQFIITGSSARKLKNLLPGRLIRYHMDPLTLIEAPFKDIAQCLINGTLPGITNLKDQSHINEELDSYVINYIEEEIRKEALIRKISTFIQFLKLAAIESGNHISFRKLSQEIGVAHTTISEYYNILEECMIIEKFSALTKTHSRKRLSKSPRYIFFDLGIRRTAAEEGENPPLNYFGHLFEQWVGLELKRLSRFSSKKIDITFWKSHDGPEVDWIIKENNRLTPIEVKWTESPSIKDARHLQTFLKEYKDQTEKAYIICRCQNPQKISPTITALPWQNLPTLIN